MIPSHLGLQFADSAFHISSYINAYLRHTIRISIPVNKSSAPSEIDTAPHSGFLHRFEELLFCAVSLLQSRLEIPNAGSQLRSDTRQTRRLVLQLCESPVYTLKRRINAYMLRSIFIEEVLSKSTPVCGSFTPDKDAAFTGCSDLEAVVIPVLKPGILSFPVYSARVYLLCSVS